MTIVQFSPPLYQLMRNNMPSFYSEYMQIENSPDYQKGYQEGFEDAKRASVKRLKKIAKEIDELEAFTSVTTTTP